MPASIHGARGGARTGHSSEQGFSLLELVLVVTIVCTLTGIAVGLTPSIVRAARGDSGAQALDAFLKRSRETAIGRRRDIEVRFIAPNIVESAQRPVPPATDVQVLETMTFEGGLTYWKPDDIVDTPDAFGNEEVIELGGSTPVMFSSEGAFIDAAGNPINATISLGVEGDPQTATAVTILGSTATIRRWRWNLADWIR